MAGFSELDVVTRFRMAVRKLETLPRYSSVPVQELFRTPVERSGGAAVAARWLSGGYLAFRLRANELFAFPPGYNEDWLWSDFYVPTQLCVECRTESHSVPCDGICIPSESGLHFLGIPSPDASSSRTIWLPYRGRCTCPTCHPRAL